MDDLEEVFHWISKLRKDYSPHSDIWHLRRDWQHIKEDLLTQINDPEKLLDQSLYIALRIQKSRGMDEITHPDYLSRVCLESELYTKNPNAELRSLINGSSQHFKELQNEKENPAPDQSHEALRDVTGKDDTHLFFKQVLRQKLASKTDLTPTHQAQKEAHAQFEHSMHATIKQYAHDVTQRFTLQAKIRQQTHQLEL